MYYNIYFSPTGGTKKVADILAKHLQGEYKDIDLCLEVAAMTLSENDICLISVPSYGGRVPAANIERLKKIGGNGAKAILNCVYGNRHWDDTLSELQDVLESLGFICVSAVAAVAEHSVFRQFGAGRPDAEDERQLIGFAHKIQAKIDANTFEKSQFPGKHGNYKVYNGVPFKPEGKENCISCGLCAKSCPVAAISFENPKATDKEKCISCMRCICLCPVSARSLDAALMKSICEKLTPALNWRKENYLFL